MSSKEKTKNKRVSISVTMAQETLNRLDNMPEINRSRFVEEAAKERMDELGY